LRRESIVASDPPDTTGRDDATPLAVRCVRALLERHGLPKYRQSPWLAEATGLSYSQAHRKMSGAASWTLEELEHVGSLFGESLSDVVALGQDPGSVRGVVRLGEAGVDCQIWLGPPIDHPHPSSVVAVKTSLGWSALCASEVNDGTMYRVDRLDVRPGADARKVVAVLDDDHDLTNSICAHLDESGGYEARPFYRTADLLSATQVRRFDAYVIDWIVGETSTQKLIAGLREKDAACPIVVLTAQVLSGVVDEADIAKAVKAYDLVFSEKPVRMSILSATLARSFAATVTRAGP
jgi:ActR/RegA family two-component response regulator